MVDLVADEERIERLAGVVAAHTRDICLLASTYSRGSMVNDECQQKILVRCTRTCIALLAVLHEEGPP